MQDHDTTGAIDPFGPASSRNSETHVKALERGLRVLVAISDMKPPIAVSEVARAVQITRTAARRFMLTLEHLGYVKMEGSGYILQPRILELGDAYLRGHSIVSAGRKFIKELAEHVSETVSLTMLHQGLVTYIDRVQASRLLAINIVVGSRVPAHATATGRVLLAGLDDAELSEYLRSVHLEKFTESTITEAMNVREDVLKARKQGWYMADQHLRSGIRSLAVPVVSRSGRTVAALNIAASAARISADELLNRHLRPMQDTADKIGAELT